ncbi:MAG: diguanylate cyclase [Desulfocucumaceae bacterium]
MENSSKKILIIDDVPSNILILREILQEDYEIFFSTSGKEGLEIALSEKPDLILLDVMMPQMDGYEVCARLKADPLTRAIPVIFVTAMGEMEDEARGLEAGAIDYIIKPIRPSIVKARVKNHLELKKYRDLLENLSAVDGLTGIANRRHLDGVLDTEWRRALRGSEKLSLIMIDIDFFKKYNDSYGHLAGDDCLRRVANIIKESVKRAGDLVARYGGEEFAVILPSADEENAYTLAEVIRENIESLKIPHHSSEISDWLTVSVGVATVIPHIVTPPTSLIGKADEALYRAKREGRNRVVSNSGLY